MIKKRLFSALLVLSLLCSAVSVTAVAVEPRASTTLLSYGAVVAQGDNKGEIRITYDVEANKMASEVGVATLKIYRESDDVCMETITGTVSNGLLRADASRHRSSYTWTKGISGTYYYAVLTVTATIGSDTDTREYTTASVKAP